MPQHYGTKFRLFPLAFILRGMHERIAIPSAAQLRVAKERDKHFNAALAKVYRAYIHSG